VNGSDVSMICPGGCRAQHRHQQAGITRVIGPAPARGTRSGPDRCVKREDLTLCRARLRIEIAVGRFLDDNFRSGDEPDEQGDRERSGHRPVRIDAEA